MISIEVLTGVLLLCILVTFALGAPVGLALGGIAMAVGYVTWGDALFNVIPTTLEDTHFSFILLAIPLYIYMGQLLTRSGIGDAMFSASQMLIGRVRGSLAISDHVCVIDTKLRWPYVYWCLDSCAYHHHSTDRLRGDFM